MTDKIDFGHLQSSKGASATRGRPAYPGRPRAEAGLRSEILPDHGGDQQSLCRIG